MPAYIKLGDIKGESSGVKNQSAQDHFDFKSDGKPGSNGYTEVEWTYSKSGASKQSTTEVEWTYVEWTYDDGPQDMGDMMM